MGTSFICLRNSASTFLFIDILFSSSSFIIIYGNFSIGFLNKPIFYRFFSLPISSGISFILLLYIYNSYSCLNSISSFGISSNSFSDKSITKRDSSLLKFYGSLFIPNLRIIRSSSCQQFSSALTNLSSTDTLEHEMLSFFNLGKLAMKFTKEVSFVLERNNSLISQHL